MTANLQTIIDTHPGLITADGGITWYTPDELLQARKTDWHVDAMDLHENEWQLPIDIYGDEFQEISDYLRINGLNYGVQSVVAEYVRRTGNAVFMRTRA